jgi:DNA helicase-2/ATP-dependent DNA helicase PcrA
VLVVTDEASLPARLGAVSRGSVIAAAGCGKTRLIASTVAHLGDRQLVLTHTNSGVDALRRRLRQLGVSSSVASIDTLDGWCLKFVSSYPKLTGGLPVTTDGSVEWKELRTRMAALLSHRVIRDVVRASYTGALVDEYQDCTKAQHTLVTKLAGIVPARVLGDPLQAIFNFRDDPSIAWTEVENDFPLALRLETPWRWSNPGANAALGEWLREVRRAFETGKPVSLRDARVRFIPFANFNAWSETARDACMELAGAGGTVAAICKWPSEFRLLSKMMGGLFQCVEQVEAKDARALLLRIENGTALEWAELLLKFAGEVAVHVREHIEAIRPAMDGTAPASAELANVVGHLRNLGVKATAGAIADALEALVHLPGARLHRRELLWAVLDTLRDVGDAPPVGLAPALRRRRNLMSHVGRRLARCSAGSTLLMKGMEVDHAVVVHTGGNNGLGVKDLYVALTRGAKSLTIVSLTDVLDPKVLPA